MREPNNQTDQARNSAARTTAMAAVDGLSVKPTGIVRYQSRGRVIVIGGEEAQWLAARLQDPLHAEVLLTDGAEEPGVPTTCLGGRPMRIDGHLGAFQVELGDRGRHNYQRLQADMIVDLSPGPLIDRALPPPGYWHFGCGQPDLDAAVIALDGMVGTFEKPRYFAYDPSVCAHARAGQQGCRRCIDACPAEAIVSIGEQVEVNPNLCQGGGVCTAVCPTGAMRYAYPGPGDTAERLRLMLRSYAAAGGTDPEVVFVAGDDVGELPELAPNTLLQVIEELASVGHEIWFATLAWGARRVVLADGGSVPASVRDALQQQVAFSQAILQGLGYDPTALCLVDAGGTAEVGSAPTSTIANPGTFAADDDKRQLAMMALDHLWSVSPLRPEHVTLPQGAPYGRIGVDTEKCTLCMSCTSVCPARALSAGDEVPRLVFHEANCVQCGICENACPESAIRLEPRLSANPANRRQAEILFEEPPFCCVSCGQPFATRRAIDNILAKLEHHAMFQSERARRRLQMCEDCRVVDAVQDADAMQSGLDLQPGPTHKN